MNKNKINEKKLSKIFVTRLKEMNIVNDPFQLEAEVPVPYQHVYLPSSSKQHHKMDIWCYNQDIAIFLKLVDKDSIKREYFIKNNNNEPLVDIQIQSDKKKGNKNVDIGLPYVIIELKVGQPNTHDILAYNQKCAMIKTVFPFCHYIFLVHGEIAPRTYRYGVNFDEIIEMKDINEITLLKEKIVYHFNEAKKKLKNMELGK